ncbi:hypothetical protein [Streptomyces regalis]|uniref:hypothetical protein n=1 Tax=Streptomyces regalis TaxID=68262 RepID=UPI00131BB512|nr:hypothetical protein [Streptomyces regalis]
MLGVGAGVLGRLSGRSGISLMGSWRVRLLSGWVDRLLGRVTNVLGVDSSARADLAGAGVATATRYSEDDDGSNYSSKADNANRKDNEAH